MAYSFPDIPDSGLVVLKGATIKRLLREIQKGQPLAGTGLTSKTSSKGTTLTALAGDFDPTSLDWWCESDGTTTTVYKGQFLYPAARSESEGEGEGLHHWSDVRVDGTSFGTAASLSLEGTGDLFFKVDTNNTGVITTVDVQFPSSGTAQSLWKPTTSATAGTAGVFYMPLASVGTAGLTEQHPGPRYFPRFDLVKVISGTIQTDTTDFYVEYGRVVDSD